MWIVVYQCCGDELQWPRSYTWKRTNSIKAFCSDFDNYKSWRQWKRDGARCVKCKLTW